MPEWRPPAPANGVGANNQVKIGFYKANSAVKNWSMANFKVIDQRFPKINRKSVIVLAEDGSKQYKVSPGLLSPLRDVK